MSERVVVSIYCVNKAGLLTAVFGRLAELGCNLADTTFAVLSGSAKFTAVCALAEGLAGETLWLELQRVPELAGGSVTVRPFAGEPTVGPRERITHRFEFEGRDRPGLLLALTEAFNRCGATVVRLNSHTQPTGDETRHVMRFAVAVPEAAPEDCLAAVTEVARSLDLDCRVESA